MNNKQKTLFASLSIRCIAFDFKKNVTTYLALLLFLITAGRASAVAPTIASFSPASGAVGTLVTITGTNLTSPTALTVGGVAAIAISNTGTSLVVMVMPGAVAGSVVVTTSGGTATSASNFTVTPTQYPGIQQGSKLVGTGNTGAARQGYAVAVSADGNTAIVGGIADNSSQGAAWIYTRSGTTWTQQGSKLVGTGNIGAAAQGIAVAISADGNTALVGSGDNSNQGAVWVFTRSGATWTQQGNKLVGTGNTGVAFQSTSIAISADGNTAVIGGYADNTNQGAVWVFTRSGTTWAQQGNKLVGTGNTGAAYQGTSVAISADGNTLIEGGTYDNSTQGAVWVFTRSGSTWTQQGNKLIGTGNTGAAYQGTSVAISADGNTIIEGGSYDNTHLGAAWVFTRSGTTWTQQGSKLVGTGNTGVAYQGTSVSISADGNTAMIGAPNDNTNQGAAWVFTRSGTTWAQQGSKLVGNGNTGYAYQGFTLSLSADGSTGIMGGFFDNALQGAAWVFVPCVLPTAYTVTGGGGYCTGGTGVAVGLSNSQTGINYQLQLNGSNTGSPVAGTGAAISFGNQTTAGTYTVVGGLCNTAMTGSVTVTINALPTAGITGTATACNTVSLTATGGTSYNWSGGATPTTAANSFTTSGTYSLTATDVNGCTATASQVVSVVGTPSFTFSPSNGPVGTLVAITGTNLSTTTAVTIGGVAAIIISNTGSSVVAMVMPGATTGNVSVSNLCGPVNGTGSFTVIPSSFPAVQQGSKLVGTGNSGAPRQGYSVAVSADGNTAIVGAPVDNSNQGAAWIYTRSAGVWTQQGNKLVGTGNIGAAYQGQSVAISADGNTALVSGSLDNSSQGAVWVFTRSGTTWTQQGNKLVGTGSVGAASQGWFVSLSADGNTALVGAYADNNFQGAAWVFTRSGTTWSQQGNKLVGTGNTGPAYQGQSVAISADGNTAVVGGNYDNTNQGAVWVFTRSGTTWAQQGSKLVGSGNVGSAYQGQSVAISANGNTVIVGGNYDNSQLGAAWVFTRSGVTWTQQGSKLVGSGGSQGTFQGTSVSISADGNTAMVGGPNDNGNLGATWVFIRTGTTWSQQGSKLVGSGYVGTSYQGSAVAISADGNTGLVGGYRDNSLQGASWVFALCVVPTSYAVTGGGAYCTGGTGVAVGLSNSQTGVSYQLQLNGTNTGSPVVGTGAAISFGNQTTAGTYTVVGGACNTAMTGSVAVTINALPTAGITGTATACNTASLTATGGTSYNWSGGATPTTAANAFTSSGTYTVTVTNANSCTATASQVVTINGISSFTPASGPVGTLVTITGTGFSSATSLTIGGVSAITISNTGTSLVAMVMPGATTGNISMAISCGTVTSASNFTVTPTSYPGVQQGAKLVGTGVTGGGQQGFSVAISADGNTAVVGGINDNNSQGAVWVYTRSGTTWTQQGSKLVGTGNTGAALQGYSVAISADGNTILTGGIGDNSYLGAAWVFTRSGTTWTQQGSKLVGGTSTTGAQQGYAVALSADGNTALVGGSYDNARQGAIWVFTRSGSTWTQQGNKLLGTGNSGAAYQGYSIAISADGNTFIEGGAYDNGQQGAAWVFTRSGSTWTQQGNKLLGTGNSGANFQGNSVAISADGNTAMVAGYTDNAGLGAAWIYTRSGTTWSQQGNKLVGTGSSGANVNEGYAVSLSADGNTALMGGPHDNSNQGAVWVFTRSGTTWTQQGSKFLGTGNTGAAYQGCATAISADGNTSIIGGFLDNSSQGAAWVFVPCTTPTVYSVTGAGVYCAGGTGTPIGLSGSQTGINYQLQVNGTNTGSPVAGTGAALSFGNQTAAGVYTIVAGLCSTPMTGTVTLNALPTAGITGTAIACGSVSLTATGGTSYNWSGGATPATAANTFTSSGTYTVTVTNANNCTASTSQVVTVNTIPTAGITGAATACGSVSLTATGGTSYNWSGGATPTTAANTFTSSGTYNVTVTGSNGCTATTSQLVTVNAVPTAGITGTATACGSVSLTATGGTSYNWSGGATPTTAANTFITSGTYSVTVTNVNGCTASASQIVTVNTIPTAGITGAATACGTVSLTATGGTSYNWSGGATPTTAANTFTSSGTYNVTVTGSNGCTATTSQLVTVNAVPTAGITGTATACGPVSITATGGVSYNWSGGATPTTAANTFTVSGTYTVTVTSSNSCTATASQVVATSTAIFSFTPNNGAVGTLVTITGTGLSSLTALTIGGVAAIPVSNTGTSLVAMVMPGAATGNISLTGSCGIATSTGNFTVIPTPYPSLQQGGELVGTGNIGAANQGISVAVSADGNTAVVGGMNDNSSQGAVWIYTRSGTVWAQQGGKLVGTGATGYAQQGWSVAISADGNTVIAGGETDNNNQGAAWIFIRSGSTWTQQGTKLVGIGNVGTAYQGMSVAISADGNTALVGGGQDNNYQGAVWVFTRSGVTWTQQGSKLVGTGNTGAASQGASVALSADGNTAIIGGKMDNNFNGAAWIFTRSGTTWTQQGSKLVGSGGLTNPQQGYAVSLSADGNTAIVGGPYDNTNLGAAWIFTRSGSTWGQQGSKLVGTGSTGTAQQGSSLAVSADGNTVIVGGSSDNSQQGASWVYTRSGTTWTQQGSKLLGLGNTGAASQGISVAMSADGTTTIIGGASDNAAQGAAWVFVPSCVIPAAYNITGGGAYCTGGTGVPVGVDNSQSGVTYQLRLNGTNTGSPVAGTGAAISFGNQTTAGTYTVVASQGTCTATTTGSVIITINALPTASITGTATACGSVSLIATGGTSYSWSGGAMPTTAANAFTASGTYVVTVTDANGCTATATQVVTVNTSSTISSFSPNTGAVGTLVTITGTGLNNPTAITIGGVAAIPISNTGISLVAMVMPGATSGNISITNTCSSVTSTGSFTVTPTPYPGLQQGNKLVGTGNTGVAQQGASVAISADGNTAIVGGLTDNSEQGAAWVYIRSGSTWTQQGSKLVGTGNTGAASQGCSVAISADGNTAIIGGNADNSYKGAAWVFTRSGTTWTQQGSKLVGTGSVGTVVFQGCSVTISADGNTAIIGACRDNNSQGAAWVFTRSGTTWTQQGSKLVGTGSVGTAPYQGCSVTISADGNTAIIGGYGDNNQGAAWVFTRSGTTWTQQGSKLVGTGAISGGMQGYSVSVSSNGNTAIIGGPSDNGGVGAVWVFTRSGTTWTQQGSKLVGTGSSGPATQGQSVAISADGNTLIEGGYQDNYLAMNSEGAIWVFTRSGNTWSQQGSKLVGTASVNGPWQGYSAAISADGSTAIEGGMTDNTFQGAAWVFTPSCTTPTAYIMTGGGAYCTGGTGVPVGVANSQSGVTYQLQLNGSNTGSPVAGTGAAITFGSQTAAGTYTVVASQGSCTANMTGSVTIAINALPTAGITGTATACGSVSLTATGGTSYNWSGGATPTASANTFTTSGTYNVTVTDASGCTATASQVVSVNPLTTIASFSPSSGPVGTLVTITGTGLSNPTSITIGGVVAIPVSNTGTSLVAMVMPGATTGGISITATCGTVTSTGNFTITATPFPGIQQGNKLVGTGNLGAAQQGWSVAVSADGNTAIVGGNIDNSWQGAAWVYTRSGTSWTQQTKLVCTGNTGTPKLGWSVALSADGNTAAVGGAIDNANQGAVWVFTRSGTSWTQQGNKLVGTGSTGTPQQGTSVALSADGNTLIEGGTQDNISQGAAWVFTRSGTAWTQQGTKLVGTGSTGAAQQGISVALCADGNTAIVGGYADNTNQGAAWVFTRSGTTWTQQGSKLVGTGNIGAAKQGASVALSADGNTAMLGGYGDNAYQGAAWVFTRSGTSWTQQGNKLVGTGNTGAAYQGVSVGLSADGNTAIMGATADNTSKGAMWVFTRSVTTWAQQGAKLVGSGSMGVSSQGMVALSSDGTSAIMGGMGDNSFQGAAWVFAPCVSPTVFNITGGGAYCTSGTGVPVGVANSQSGVTYQLQLNGSNTGSPVAGTGAVITFGSQTAAGTYTVVASQGSCTANMTGSVTVTINALPTAGITGTATACTTVSLTATGGTSYSWSGGATPTTAANSFTSSGTYNVTVTDANSCTATASRLVTVNTVPTAGITGTATACTTVSLTATGGTSYSWSGGATPTTAANSFTSSNTYTVTVTDANSCTATASRVVTVNTVPTAGITGTATACTTVSLTATGGTSYSWSGGATPTTAANSFTSSNTYTVTVTDANSCTATASRLVTVNTVPTAGITGTATACTTVSLTATGGTSYSWSGGATPTTAANSFTSSGTYNVTVTDVNSCTATTSQIVVVNTIPVITCPVPFTVNATLGSCGINLALSATVTGIPTPSLSFSPANNSFFNAGLTTVTATATNTCGTVTCSYPITVNVNDPTSPTANAVVTSATLNWTSGNSGNGYQVKYQTGSAAFNPATLGTAVNGSGSTATLSGLTAATAYHWYIREVCGTAFSNWIDGGTFTTNSGTVPANTDPCAGVSLPFSTGQQMGFSTYGQFLGMTCNLLTQSNANAIELAGQPVDPSCSDGLVGNHKTLWYTFTTPACVIAGNMPFTMNISTDNTGTALTADTYLELFSSSTGNCGGVFTSVACNNNYAVAGCSPTGNTNASTLNITGTLLPSTTYYLRVGNYSVTAPGGNLVLSMTIEPAAPVVTANVAAPYDYFDVNVANTASANYVYYYRQVGSTGYNSTITTSPTFTSGQLAPGNDYEVQVQHRCVTGNQIFRTPVVTYHVPALVGCASPSPLVCGALTSTSVSFSWPAQANLYTGGGIYSGYVLYYRVTGNAGYNYFTNLVPTSCTAGVCTATITGLLANTSYDVWIGARCTAATILKSNTITCNTTLTAAPRQPITDDVYTFTVGATEYHDVRLTDNWSDFGLTLPTTGSAYIDVSTGRARVLSQEGGYELSPEAFAPAKATGLGFDLVPNPTTSATNVIIYTAEPTNAICTVFDLQGNVVANEVLTDVVNGATVRIATDRLAAGVYMVAVKTATNGVTKKLVVIK